ncbi:UDP-N-acetylglucosaminyltransferase [Aspergillus saccharolyticus JOP 1030-1]|uniref:protein O-GlcNAc transferase n=1 Tax=Aspergillus saccharolyticus JOP 1030-1 TaxID=1450539 RepID=A0A318ZQZ8_9EURO|nr:UDP-N-acetylglucosaminyltransferase [Aspergillus saccharolyticus JOP 1030-1]PYH50031.1 UDP-N-acetylglucosaminyltransferase [Aspergillus saccharolyticus JOP 1030-1]
MLPSVAPFPPVQPHHLHYRHGSDSLNDSYDLNAAFSATLPHNDASKNSFQSVPRTRLQYPHPIQRLGLPDAGGPSTSSKSAGEHALRRKTPNGTLAAGYDGTPGDTTIQPPASKHILVSPLESGHLIPSQAGFALDSWQQQQQQPAFDRASSGKQLNFPPVYKNEATRGNALTGEIGQAINGASWVRSLNYVPGIDSVLNQTLPMQPSQQRFYWHNGAYIPTVLPATLQPCLGPTASAGTGPYGPYWPDGAYIPYRPAAFRDTRFHSLSPFPKAGNSSGLQFIDAIQPPLNRSGLPAASHPDSGIAWNQNPTGMLNAELPMQNNFPRRHSEQKVLDTSSHQLVLPFHTRQPTSSSSFSPRPPHDASSWSNSAGNQGFQNTESIGSSRAANAEFKEKVLTWAHGVYVDLLASIHQARRNSISNSSTEGQSQRLLKPSIYPKPPRQPGLDFSTAASSAPSRHNSFPTVQLDYNGSRSNAGNHLGQHDSSRHLERPTLAQFSQTVSDVQMLDRIRHTGRFSTSTSASRPGVAFLDEGSTTANAVSSLEMLSHLCMESGWEWIDGMLLGGCLAYGLGDYNKATRWYSRIIARDATHVEAISNLAATLLALDRRDEALQHWLRAVKLRPSYFEAVEHLIGLLCSSQRGKEAVNIIEFVQNSLRSSPSGECFKADEHASETESDAESRASSASDLGSYEKATFDYDDDFGRSVSIIPGAADASTAGFGSSGYDIPGCDNGRILALVHAKGNMLYALGDNVGAAAAFEDAILIAAGRKRHRIQNLIKQIFSAFMHGGNRAHSAGELQGPQESILLYPEQALQTSKLVFAPCGTPPGIKFVAEGLARKAAISTTSNSLLSLAKIYQDGMGNISTSGVPKAAPGVRDILALYYLSLSLQPSPSTANNVGILLAGIHHKVPKKSLPRSNGDLQHPEIPGVVPGTGISLALAYYNYGLHLDSRHAHLYTNLGSLLKDIGQLQAAIRMYEQAVQCDGNFDIALANLANAVKDAGRVNDAIAYYKRAVKVNPEFAEAVCGLANALNSVCNWVGRGGVGNGIGFRDRWHVDEQGMLRDAYSTDTGAGWIKRVVEIVDRQLKEGEFWGQGLLTPHAVEQLCAQLIPALRMRNQPASSSLAAILQSWAGQRWEGARVVRLVERAIRSITWQWYQDRYVQRKEYPLSKYRRPQLPSGLTAPNAPTVLPFHTFTCPLSAKQIRQISQRNGLRISCSTLRSPWLPATVYPPPPPPNPYLKVGYVSSDFNNHPLAHLMQSVFGLHNPSRVKAYCYATTASDRSIHRQQIEKEAPVFYDASGWPVDHLVKKIVEDGIHILINLNGYTRGARNEVFAARPAPIHMSFMGFAGTLGAEWCDYILADEISIPPETLAPGRRNVRIEDRLLEENHGEDLEHWVYGEKLVYTRDTFFCCDHRQSAPDAQDPQIAWEQEQSRRWRMRKELFPNLSDDTIILGNFNQLYKIEPTTFRTWLRILAHIPNAVLWLLRFPDLGERNLKETAIAWAGEETASRIIFTDVAPKNMHIARARVLDLFLDTPECNAHTTATDVLWSGTPLLTFPRYKYKMCSRMASSILSSALPDTDAGRAARDELIATSDEDYEAKAIRMCLSMNTRRTASAETAPTGRLTEIRKMLFQERWKGRLFDTARWVRDLEDAYDRVWQRWVVGEEGDIWL